MIKLVALIGVGVGGLMLLGWVDHTYHNPLLHSGVLVGAGVAVGLILKGK